MQHIKNNYSYRKIVPVFETHGIIEFDSLTYNELLNKIIHDINNYTGNKTYTLKYNNEFINTFNCLIYKDNVSWIKQLNVLFKFVDIIDEDYFCITKSEFTINEQACYVIKNNKLEISTIVLYIDKSNISYLKGILKHELKHLFYFLKTHITINKSNMDIRFLESYDFIYNYPLEFYLQNFYKNKTIDIKYIDEFIVKSLYYLNLNECRAHLENIYQEIKDGFNNKYLNILSKKYAEDNKTDVYIEHLKLISNTYLLYSILNDMYRFLNDNHITNNLMNDLSTIYKVNNYKSFYNLMINRINEEVLLKSKKLYFDVYEKNSDI